MKRTSLASLVAVGLLASSTARAEEFEVGVAFGYGRVSGGAPVSPAPVRGFLGTSAAVSSVASSDPVAYLGAMSHGGGPVARFFGGKLFLDGALAIGVSVGGRVSLPTDDQPRGIDVAPRVAWRLGPYARLRPFARGALEAWISIGLDYVHDRQTYRFLADAESHATHHGLSVPLAIGVDARVSPHLSIGPSFELTRVFPLSACYDGPAFTLDPNTATTGASYSTCTGDADGRIVANAYTTWSIAIGSRVEW